MPLAAATPRESGETIKLPRGKRSQTQCMPKVVQYIVSFGTKVELPNLT
jgi:hypothetical protein